MCFYRFQLSGTLTLTSKSASFIDEILARLFKLVDSRSSRFWNRTNFPSCIMFKMSNSGLCSSLWAWVRTGKRPWNVLSFVFGFLSILDFVIKKNPLLNQSVWRWRILSNKTPIFLLYQKSESKLGENVVMKLRWDQFTCVILVVLGKCPSWIHARCLNVLWAENKSRKRWEKEKTFCCYWI